MDLIFRSSCLVCLTHHYIKLSDNPTKFDMDNYKNFFENLGEVIPCEVCKAHYKKNIKMYPIQLESKES